METFENVIEYPPVCCIPCVLSEDADGWICPVCNSCYPLGHDDSNDYVDNPDNW